MLGVREEEESQCLWSTYSQTVGQGLSLTVFLSTSQKPGEVGLFCFV